ncbi:MAG: Gfo/Idh/MocA family oxidoreductase [Chloroflexota bacterium]|jgi:predicted dehydrogenase|nr:Gfo/Idh/MocA family oxidoreductase [Chloroflexota bacterium]MDP6756783.1 Gfo/Idh/MocA family oxidoreductase [Chloroflexota bacterium]
MAKSIGVGVIGIGMGSTMLPLNLDEDSPFEIRSLCSGTASKVEALANEWDIGHWTTDYREVINRSDVDVIGVYSPDHLHAEHVTAALDAGKHIVCTKPMVTSADDAARIVKLVDEKGVKFLVGQTMRFEPEFTAAKSQLDRGLLGDLILVEGHYVHDMRHVFPFTPWRRDVPQDMMYGGISHPLDIMRWLVGDIAEVHAYGNRAGLTPEVKMKSNFILNVKFVNGVMGRVLGVYDVVHPPMPMMGIGLWGSKGTLMADYTDLKGGHINVVYDDIEGQPVGKFDFPPETLGAYGHGDTVLRYMAQFADCLENDREPSPNVRDGAKSVATCTAAAESVETGEVVKVNNAF